MYTLDNRYIGLQQWQICNLKCVRNYRDGESVALHRVDNFHSCHVLHTVKNILRLTKKKVIVVKQARKPRSYANPKLRPH